MIVSVSCSSRPVASLIAALIEAVGALEEAECDVAVPISARVAAVEARHVVAVVIGASKDQKRIRLLFEFCHYFPRLSILSYIA